MHRFTLVRLVWLERMFKRCHRLHPNPKRQRGTGKGGVPSLTLRVPMVLKYALILTIGLARPGYPANTNDKPAADGNVISRGTFTNSRIQFERGGKGHVAFMGGSITEMEGYRPLVCEILKRRYPQCQFTFTDAGISSTCSTTGAFRLKAHVLDEGPVDLFFVEFAVNDDQDAGHAKRECIRGMEGIVRHLRQHNPCADIVITYFVNPGMVELYEQGKTPLSISSHATVADYYGISTINLAREVTQQIAAGELTWQKFGGTHPAPHGNAICAGMIDQLLGKAWSKPLPADAKKRPHDTPDRMLDAKSYCRGRFMDPQLAKTDELWELQTPNWKVLPGNCRGRFVNEKLLCADRPGAELTLAFSGTAVGAYVLAGPDAGTLTASVDGGEPKTVDLHHRFSHNLHYPRTVMFAADLEEGEHTLRLRIAESKTPASRGHAVRILSFAAN